MIDEVLVNKILDQMRPMMQRDGGDVTLVKVEGTLVYIRLMGACAGCPISFMTVTYGIQDAMQREIPDIEQVIVVRD